MTPEVVFCAILLTSVSSAVARPSATLLSLVLLGERSLQMQAVKAGLRELVHSLFNAGLNNSQKTPLPPFERQWCEVEHRIVKQATRLGRSSNVCVALRRRPSAGSWGSFRRSRIRGWRLLGRSVRPSGQARLGRK